MVTAVAGAFAGAVFAGRLAYRLAGPAPGRMYAPAIAAVFAAVGLLQAKLLARRRLEEQAKMDALKGDSPGSWGSQMRSYVLHPYQMVKDLRTEYEVGNPTAVFDGDLDGFLEAGIRWRRTLEREAE